MAYFRKRTIACFLAMILIASMILALPLTALGSGNDDGTGVYEGAYDANGKRSGYGIWAYHNYLYVGQWANDLPNGEGTLYRNAAVDENGIPYLTRMVLHGNWVDGFADGTVEVAYFSNDGRPTIWIIHDLKDGSISKEQRVVCLNARQSSQYTVGELVGWVPPLTVYGDIDVNSKGDTPWDLYEKYPTGHVPYTPLAAIENTGMSITSGNLANREAVGSYHDIAKLADWIFIASSRSTKKGDVISVYKMRPDGSQMLKLYEGNSDDAEYLSPKFQLIGDWLYAGTIAKNRGGSEEFKLRAEDADFTVEESPIWGLVIDDWEYEVYSAYGESTALVRKTKLDYSERIEGSFTIDRRILKSAMQGPEIVFVNEDWIYTYISNDGDYFSIPQSDAVSQIVRMKMDGSGGADTYSFREGIVNPYQLNGMPQFTNDRMYYLESYCVDANGITVQSGSIDRVESSLHSVNIDFIEAPVTVIPRNEEQHITSFHATNDFIYYGIVSTGTGQGAIMRANLDGGNSTVLADGFETGYSRLESGLVNTGNMDGILIAGDWMLFRVYDLNARKIEDQSIWYLMRLDGSDLHRLGEPFVPSNAPGITDSTGKWRYELLEDGSAAILGAGSKLKQTGKLSIPATVDKIAVTAIGENAFYGCDGFTSVTIPKSIITIGDFAFFWCKGLTGVTIPEGVTHIGSGAFQYCSKIKKVSLSASLASVGSNPFADCDVLKLSIATKNETFEIVDGALSVK